MINKLRIIRDNSSVGIGSTIFRGLHYLYYKDPSDILYLDFVNVLYGDSTTNSWSLYLKQPFESYNIQHYIETGNVSYEPLQLNSHPFLFCYGGAQENGKFFEDIEKVSKFRASLRPYLMFREIILQKVEEFLRKIDGKILSIHVRGTDQFGPNGHAQGQRHLFTYDYIKEQVDQKIDEYDYIFLATDEQETYDNFVSDYGDKLITYSTIRASKGNQTGLHLSSTNKSPEEKYLMGEEAIIDSIIMSKCDYSFYVKSNISLLSILLRDDFNYNFIDNHIDYTKLG